MQLTELEAKDKICPRTLNLDFPRCCIGSKCMAWTWTTPEYEIKSGKWDNETRTYSPPEGAGWEKSMPGSPTSTYKRPIPASTRQGECGLTALSVECNVNV